MAHCRSATRSLVRWRCCRAPVSAPGTARCHACAGFACLVSGASPRMRGSHRALALNHPGHTLARAKARAPRKHAPAMRGHERQGLRPPARKNRRNLARRGLGARLRNTFLIGATTCRQLRGDLQPAPIANICAGCHYRVARLCEQLGAKKKPLAGLNNSTTQAGCICCQIRFNTWQTCLVFITATVVFFGHLTR